MPTTDQAAKPSKYELKDEPRVHDNNNDNNNDDDDRRPLRELSDFNKIFKSVSGEPHDHKFRQRPLLSRDHSSDAGDSSQIISNPMHFPNQFYDPMESRYESSEDEENNGADYAAGGDASASNTNEQERTNNMASPKPDSREQVEASQNENLNTETNQNQPPTQRSRVPFTHSQTFSSFLPSMFSNNHHQHQHQHHQPPTETPEGTEINDADLDQMQRPGFGSRLESTKQPRLKNKLKFWRKKDKERFSYNPNDESPDESEKLRRERALELLTNLSMGSPAIRLMGACLLEDESGIARAPLLLTLLGFQIYDVTNDDLTKFRRFRIDVEYGFGIERMQWSIERSTTELFYLHSKLKIELWRKDYLANITSKDTPGNKLPKLPFPPLKKNTDKSKQGLRLKKLDLGRRRQSLAQDHDHHHDHDGGEGEEDNEDEDEEDDADGGDGASLNTVRSRLSRLRLNLGSITSAMSHEHKTDFIERRKQKNAAYIREVEDYLRKLILFIKLRPQSNYVFAFFEISPLSALLSYESGYMGKQGDIHIRGTAKSQGWRVGHFKVNDLKGIYDRRVDKWMLTRDSYIVYVSNINSTTPLDVFLVDSNFKITTKNVQITEEEEDEEEPEGFETGSLSGKKLKSLHNNSKSDAVFSHLKITLENRERKLVVIPKNSREHVAWLKSFKLMQQNTIWSQKHRFDSFAPIRTNCFAQWFVDGRDYFWALSAALEMAQQTIFIHDWMLSPELYLRRPANGNQQYRIDRLLQKKAREGVKIFVIIYRNVGTTVATDSLYTKHSILSLNEKNIHVIRSPNQLLQNTYFWAHHEKLCIIDHTYAFLGGIDLCYGRFDTPDHVLTDDSPVNFDSMQPDDKMTPEKFLNFTTFVGKDYSNPRAKDFFDLDKPYVSMYDRNTTPRMPWHDIHMLTTGKAGRDLARHFVQRWNCLIRQKRPSRLTPLLLPPPDFLDEEAEAHGYSGTCNVQLLRSAGNWSLGLQEHEQSIQNAYLKLIETSQHFVYIENQFFVTACVVDGVEIKNKIGDALVERIIRAHDEGTNWKAIIVIPLMPGFEAQVDQPEGSSVRVIMQCQYMSISRGESSIFAKLKMRGINPEDYIQFFSLRKWGRIGPKRTLVTEQLYIHAKCMIVDDVSVIIGSANINERSMRGVRDSEVAAVIQDQEQITTKMNGKPYKAAKFAHTLRMRLMREHLGVSLDILDTVERRFKRFEDFASSDEGLKYATTDFKDLRDRQLSAMVELATRDVLNERDGTQRWKDRIEISGLDAEVAAFDYKEEESLLPPPLFLPVSFNNRTGPNEANRGVRDKKKKSYDPRVQRNKDHYHDVAGKGTDKYHSKLAESARVTSSEFLKELSVQVMEGTTPSTSFLPDVESVREFLNGDDAELAGMYKEEDVAQIISRRNEERWLLLKKVSYLQRVAAKEQHSKTVENNRRQQGGLDPQSSSSHGSQEHGETNGDQIVDGISTGKGLGADYVRDDQHQAVSLTDSAVKEILNGLTIPEAKVSNFMDPYDFEDPVNPVFYEYVWNEHARRNTELFRMVFHCQPDDAVSRWAEYTYFSKLQSTFMKSQNPELRDSTSSQAGSNSEEHGVSKKDDMQMANNIKRRAPEGPSSTGNIASQDEDYGLLGRVPPSKEERMESEKPKKIRNKLVRSMSSFAGARDDQRSLRSSSDGEDLHGDIFEEKEMFENNTAVPPDSETSPEVDGEMRDGTIDEKLTETADPAKLFDEINNGNGNNGNNNNQNLPNGSWSQENTNKHKALHSATQKANSSNSSYDEEQPHVRKNRAGAFLTRRKIQSGEAVYDKATAEKFLSAIQGHLVYFPTEWLSTELKNNNWFYNTDRLPPMEIYD